MYSTSRNVQSALKQSRTKRLPSLLNDKRQYPIVRTIPAVFAIIGPTQSEIHPRDLKLVPENASIWTIAPKGKYAVQINGTWISRKLWHLPIREGDFITFVHVAHGGGRGSDPLRTVLQIAVVAASLYIGNWATAASIMYAEMGASAATFVGSLASAAAVLAGSALVNAIVPLPGTPGTMPQQSPSPTYSFALSGNNLRPGAPIPERYGTEFVYPDFVASPYFEYDNNNNDQYYHAMLVWGMGECTFKQFSIEDTPLESFAGVQAVRFGPGQSTRSGPFPGVETYQEAVSIVNPNIITSSEVGGQELVDTFWTSAFTVNGPGTTMDFVWVDFVMPKGIGVIDQNGQTYQRDYQVHIQLRKIDNAGNAIGNWHDIGSYHFTGATTNPVRRTFTGPILPEGAARYQIRFRRNAMPNDPPLPGNVAELGQIVLAGVRARLVNPKLPIHEKASGIAVKIRANEQLTGISQRKIGVFATRLLKTYNPNTKQWSNPVETRNPAWAFCHVLKDPISGRGLPDSRLDLITIAELADIWDLRQDRFDYSFDTYLTVDDTLRVIARAGRALPILRRGAVYSMVRDQEQPGPVAIFMPRNMTQNTFQMDFILPTEDTPDAIKMTYRSNNTWEEEAVIGRVYEGVVYAYQEFSPPSELPDPENVAELRMPGVTGLNHALREVAYIAADNFYRRIRLSWSTELEGLMPTYGSMVSITHDVSRWAQGGDIKEFDTNTNRLYPVDPVFWTEGEQHYIRIQNRDGSVSEAIEVVFLESDPNAIQLLTPFSGTIVTEDEVGAGERSRFMFGSLSEVARLVRITGMTPQSERTIRLDAVLENNLVHSADNNWLPSPGDPEQDPPSGGSSSEGGGGSGGGEGTDGHLVRVLPGWLVDTVMQATMPVGLTYTLKNNGQLELARLNYFDSPELLSGQWLNPQPVITEVSGLYEVMFSIRNIWNSSGDDQATLISTHITSSDPFDTWLSLSTDRSVTFEYTPSVSEYTADLQLIVSIRIAATEAEVSSAEVLLGLRVAQSSGGA